jgi:hypothetical protein
MYTTSPYFQTVFGFLQSCLFLLHVYWSVLLLKILFAFLLKGESEDIVDKNRLSSEEELKGKKEK